VNKPLGIAYGTGELPAMVASSRDYHAYRSQGHVAGDLIPIPNANHFTILDELTAQQYAHPRGHCDGAIPGHVELPRAPSSFEACSAQVAAWIFASRLHWSTQT